MKRIVSLLLAMVLLSCLVIIPANAESAGFVEKVSSSTVYNEDGSYCIKDIYRVVPSGEAINGVITPTHGTAVMTYYTGSGDAIWAVSVTGYFNYEYGISAYATSASSSVSIFDSSCTFISKSSNVYGAIASASATVRYIWTYTDMTVTLTCDEYGNLS